MVRSSLAHELLQRVAIGRNQSFTPAAGPDYFGHVDVAVGIDPDPVRGEEIAGAAGIVTTAPARVQLAVTIEDAQAPARCAGGCVCSRPHAGAETKLGHIDRSLRIDEDLAGAGHVGPFGDELAVGREELDA